MANRPDLVILNGDYSSRRFEVKEGGLRLGRSSSNDIHIADEELSRNHCFFEIASESSIRVTDLASANGTYVNSEPLGNEPRVLAPGDIIEVGKTKIKVVGDGEPALQPSVDLGLGSQTRAADNAPAAATAGGGAKRALLWLLALAAGLGAVATIMLFPLKEEPSDLARPVPDEASVLKEAYYEKVEADLNGIFRYEMSLSADGVLKVKIDDVPKEKRHVAKTEKLDGEALAELGRILAFDAVREIDREYAGAEDESRKLESWTLRVVYSNRSRSIRIVNTQEPEAFRAIREKLEAFSKNQLGIWAIEYSGEKLLKLAEDAISLGRMKWEDRDVQYGNLHGSIAAYREALFYLETVDPKPACYYEAKSGMERSLKELDARYTEERFLADRAINLSQWENAKRELMILLEMIPDRKDDRHREATAKLLDVEKRMKKGAK
jgi:pSer/pThr/pTyr-binding forkhead associated (FHA) protein